MTRSFYITTPIYYVNAKPHLGHAYTSLAADVLARHHRQRGDEVFFLTGTDEHGEPVALAAEKEGVAPQDLADRNAQRFLELLPKLGVTNDFFIRTSDPRHTVAVQEILTRVRDRGYVYSGTYEGWYCPRCADFKTEQEMGPDHTCPIHEIALEQQHEDNWFFQLSAFQEPLERLYAERPDFVQPSHRYNEARAFIASGLQDVSLSRASLTWGVQVPWDPSQVFYVWFDALLNYVTALRFAREGDDLTERLWPAQYHLIAKDILKFHAVFWPALLMAADLPLPEHLFIHGYLLMDDKKMSKSLGNVLDPHELVDVFGADALRFYLFREVSFGRDGSVSNLGFETRYENELANDYGNLASRVLAMVARYREGVVGDAPLDGELCGELSGLADEVAELLDRAEISQALDVIWQRVRRLNRYVEEQAPWVLAKDPERAADLDRVLATLIEGLRVVTIVLHPYLPDSTRLLLEALAESDSGYAAAAVRAQGSGRTVSTLAPLFPKL